MELKRFSPLVTGIAIVVVALAIFAIMFAGPLLKAVLR